jgi:hypothetical protein
MRKKPFLQIFANKKEKLNFTLGLLEKTFPNAARDAIIQMSYNFLKRTF